MRAAAKRVLVVAFLVSAFAPAAAHAQIGRGWLERLSGPGPFTGPTFEARLVCFSWPDKEPADGQSSADPSSGIEDGIRFPDTDDSVVWFTPLGCHFLPRDQPRLQVGVQFSPLSSKDNALDYSHRDDLIGNDTQVNVRLFLVSADIRVNRVLDVGAGIGWASFRSEGDIFGDFSRFVYQPMRLTTRPLAVMCPSKKAEVLVVQFDGTRFKEPFTAEDFGARPGSYREPGEMNWTWALKLDLTALFWK